MPSGASGARVSSKVVGYAGGDRIRIASCINDNGIGPRRESRSQCEREVGAGIRSVVASSHAPGGTLTPDRFGRAALDLHEFARRRARDFERGVASHRVAPRRVEDDALPRFEPSPCPFEERGIRLFTEGGRVKTLIQRRVRAVPRAETTQLLADYVAPQQLPTGRGRDAGGEGRFPRRRRAADQHEPNTCGFEMMMREIEELTRIVSRVGVSLRMANARNLGTHMRAVRHVHVFQRRRPLVTRRVAVSAEEGRREIGAPETLEIHRDKCDVRENVAIAQAIIEREAVDDSWTVIQTKDVFRQEISVAVARAATTEA